MCVCLFASARFDHRYLLNFLSTLYRNSKFYGQLTVGNFLFIQLPQEIIHGLYAMNWHRFISKIRVFPF